MEEAKTRVFGVSVMSRCAEFYVIEEETIRKFLSIEKDSIMHWMK